jgi:hypothetical protein
MISGETVVFSPGLTHHRIGLTVYVRVLAFDFGFAQTNYCRFRG